MSWQPCLAPGGQSFIHSVADHAKKINDPPLKMKIQWRIINKKRMIRHGGKQSGGKRTDEMILRFKRATNLKLFSTRKIFHLKSTTPPLRALRGE